MRILSAADVHRLLTPGMALAAADRAFAAQSDGSARIPPRGEIYRDDPAGVVLFMGGVAGASLGVKLIGTLADRKDAFGRQTTACQILVWDQATLIPRGLIAADGLNDDRTAAGVAAGTRALARPDSRTHAVFGTGGLSGPCARYVGAVLPIRRLIVVSRSPANAEGLAARLAGDPLIGDAEIVTGMSADDAAASADVITTVTRSAVPVFDGSRVRPGTHVNLAGAMRATEREMDDHVAARSRFYLDSEEASMQRAGDILIPLARNVVDRSQIVGELGAVLLGHIPGRTDDGQVTVFRSMGIATQDLLLAEALLDEAERQGVGQTVGL